MTKGIDEATTQLQTYAKSAGCKSAPAEPTEQMGIFPFAVSYPARGTFQADDASSGRDLHTIFTEVHVNRNLIVQAVDYAKTILEAFAQLIKQNPTLNGTVDTVVYPFIYTFGRLEWGSIQTIGFRFEITVKVRNTL